jgi:hypothetical protein
MSEETATSVRMDLIIFVGEQQQSYRRQILSPISRPIQNLIDLEQERSPTQRYSESIREQAARRAGMSTKPFLTWTPACEHSRS